MSDRRVALRIHEAACELEALTSLMTVLVEAIEKVGETIDPKVARKVAADLARIAFDYLVAIVARLGLVEEQASAAVG